MSDQARAAFLFEQARIASLPEVIPEPKPCKARMSQPVRGDYPPIVWRCCNLGPHETHQSRGLDGRVLREWK